MKQFLLVAGLLLGSCGLMAKVDWYSAGGTFNNFNPKAKACPPVCQKHGGTWTGGAKISTGVYGRSGLCQCNVADDDEEVPGVAIES